MGDKTRISWTDATWNPIRGCSRVSEGCRHCYAEQVAARFSGPWQPYEGLAKKVGGEGRWTGKVRFIEEHLEDPLRWRKPRRIFVNSMSDLFHERVPLEQVERIFGTMALATRHTFQVLTKRPGRMLEFFRRANFNGHNAGEAPLPNVWLGVSVENQAAADERIPLLLQTPAAVRFISAEPLLGPIDLSGSPFAGWCMEHDFAGGFCLGPECEPRRRLDWVIVGGESGKGHRPMDAAWLAAIVNQCRAAHVPVWVKQDSGPKPGKQGRIPDEYWIQQMPAWQGGGVNGLG